jgi:chorismate mutase
MGKLENLRKKIDEIDLEIIKLLSRRFYFLREIVEIKKHKKDDICDKDRESIIINQIEKEASKLKINICFIKKLFKSILKESKRTQKNYLKNIYE